MSVEQFMQTVSNMDGLSEQEKQKFEVLFNGELEQNLAIHSNKGCQEDVLLVSGSFSLMKEVSEFFDLDIEVDPVEMNSVYQMKTSVDSEPVNW